jgi:hypothetical protein
MEADRGGEAARGSAGVGCADPRDLLPHGRRPLFLRARRGARADRFAADHPRGSTAAGGPVDPQERRDAPCSADDATQAARRRGARQRRPAAGGAAPAAAPGRAGPTARDGHGRTGNRGLPAGRARLSGSPREHDPLGRRADIAGGHPRRGPARPGGPHAGERAGPDRPGRPHADRRAAPPAWCCWTS